MDKVLEQIAKKIKEQFNFIVSAKVVEHCIEIESKYAIKLDADIKSKLMKIERISEEVGNLWIYEFSQSVSYSKRFIIKFREITKDELKLKPIKNYSNDEPTTNEA